MACRRRKHNPYWSGRYLFETKPDFRLVSNRYQPLSLSVAADRVGWLPVVRFCFSDMSIIFWIAVVSYHWAKTPLPQVFIKVAMRISFSWFDAIDKSSKRPKNLQSGQSKMKCVIVASSAMRAEQGHCEPSKGCIREIREQ